MVSPPSPASPTDHGLVLITGAAGYLGTVLRKGLRHHYKLRLSDRAPLRIPLWEEEEYQQANLEDAEALERLMGGVETVIHLGGLLRETALWSAILETNIAGTYNVFESARRGGVKRVIYASSHHVTGFYRRGHKLDGSEPVRPDSRYAVSKVFGEALGRLYADKYGLSVICQRIGVARPQPIHRRSLAHWVSEGDYVELTRCCIEARNVHFLTVYAVSDSSVTFYDHAAAASIGFRARDSADTYTQQVLEQNPDPEPPIESEFQGGNYCALEFEGDPDRID